MGYVETLAGDIYLEERSDVDRYLAGDLAWFPEGCTRLATYPPLPAFLPAASSLRRISTGSGIPLACWIRPQELGEGCP